MRYLLLAITLVAYGAIGLSIGRGIGGFAKGASEEDRKSQILNDPDIQTCTHGFEE